MLESLSKERHFCGCCGQVFALDEAGNLVGRERTNHERKTDISGNDMDGP
jgi:hypothetical protein